MKNLGVRSIDALSLAGLDRTVWNSVVQRGLVKDLPEAKPGKAGRLYSPDDLVALEVFTSLRDIGVTLEKAGPLHDELRARLRENATVEKLYICRIKTEDGTRGAVVEEIPASATILWDLNVPGLRRWAKACVQKFQVAYDAAD